MNDEDRLHAIFDNRKSLSSTGVDRRHFLLRLLSSLKLDVKFGRSFKNPIKSVMVTGKVEF